MTFKVVSQLKDSIAGLLQGINLDNITNLNGAIERASRTVLTNVDIPEASAKMNVTIYDGVTDYVAPSDIFGGVFMDFRPQGINRTPDNYAYKKPIELFDRTKLYLTSGTSISFEYLKGVPIMRVVQSTSRRKITLDPMTSTTGWVASGNSSSLNTDLSVYYQSPASIRFNLATSGSQGILTKSISNVDLTNYLGLGVIFLAVYLPDTNGITSFTMKIGSSASSYYSVTSTQSTMGDLSSGEWILIPFDLASASQTGTVDIKNIDYMQILTNYNGTASNNVRFGNVFISMPAPYQMIYGSSAIFKDSQGNMKNTITADSDEIILNDAAYILLENESALTVAIQSGGTLQSGTVQMFRTILYGDGRDQGLYNRYRADNPSEEIRMVGNYYSDNISS